MPRVLRYLASAAAALLLLAALALAQRRLRVEGSGDQSPFSPREGEFHLSLIHILSIHQAHIGAVRDRHGRRSFSWIADGPVRDGVGTGHISDNAFVGGDPVSFYAVKPEEADRLARCLREISRMLPGEVSQKFRFKEPHRRRRPPALQSAGQGTALPHGPVSYTHLDVYKRQDQARAGR